MNSRELYTLVKLAQATLRNWDREWTPFADNAIGEVGGRLAAQAAIDAALRELDRRNSPKETPLGLMEPLDTRRLVEGMLRSSDAGFSIAGIPIRVDPDLKPGQFRWEWSEGYR